MLAAAWGEGELYAAYSNLGKKKEAVALAMASRDLPPPALRPAVVAAAERVQRRAKAETAAQSPEGSGQTPR